MSATPAQRRRLRWIRTELASAVAIDRVAGATSQGEKLKLRRGSPGHACRWVSPSAHSTACRSYVGARSPYAAGTVRALRARRRDQSLFAFSCIAACSFWISAGDNCGRSTLIVSLLSLAVSVNGGL